MFAKLRIYIGWGLIALLLLFIFFNLEKVTVRFLIADVSMPIAFVILFSAAMGAGAVYALKFIKAVKRDSK